LLEAAVGEAAGAAAGALGLGNGGGGGAPAFSIGVRGETVKPGDAMTLTLTAGDVSAQVVAASVDAIESGFGRTRIVGRSALQTLARTRLNQVYENQTLGQIAADLASQAGVDTAILDVGSQYAYVVVDATRSVLDHLLALAAREGMDVWADAEDALTVRAFDKTAADHTFRYGIDILDLVLLRGAPTAGRVVVYGESPSSRQGTDTWHWLVKDLAPFQGEAGDGVLARTGADGAVRTKDLAGAAAVARLGAIRDGAARGRLRVLGRPDVALADAIEISGAPKPELNDLFKVESVRHVFDRRHGFVTTVGFTALGGAQAAGGALGALAGAVGGALGL
jgi:phage protein D